MENGDTPSKQFDFAGHASSAVAKYLPEQPFYESLASVIARILVECLKKRKINVHSVQHRAKDPTSFGRKSAIPSETDPNSPKYPKPLEQITDLAGVRIITFFPEFVTKINGFIHDEFEIVEQSDKGQELIEQERFGYQSVHYLVRLKPERAVLAEYESFAKAVTEVQVRTILQHAWAEIEHDIQYRSTTTIPVEIRRRFMVLAGMLELADREFQAVHNLDRELTEHASEMVRLSGDLTGVEITPKALKLFLDKRLGDDWRISEWSYDWTTRLLKSLGFRDLKQVETAIAQYNDGELNSIAFGARQGQLTRFELMLIAALGERFFERHPSNKNGLWATSPNPTLDLFKAKGIKTSTYDPLPDPAVATDAPSQTAEPVRTKGSDA